MEKSKKWRCRNQKFAAAYGKIIKNGGTETGNSPSFMEKIAKNGGTETGNSPTYLGNIGKKTVYARHFR